MEEYYVKSPGAEEADGPFTKEQLRELRQSEIIKAETELYHEGLDGFIPFSNDPTLWAELESKPSLRMKTPSTQQKEEPSTPPKSPAEQESHPPSASETAQTDVDLRYFVKSNETDEKEGPFKLNQLKELVESEYLSKQSLFQSEEMEEFRSFADETILWNKIKPQEKVALKMRNAAMTTTPGEKDGGKPKEGLKKKKQTEPPKPSPMDESGDINRMLAAAEGKTDETKHIQRLRKSRDRAVGLLIPGLVFSFFISISVIVQPYWKPIYEMIMAGGLTVDYFIDNWILIFAIVDLLLVIGIGLGQTALFPLMRLRCGIGIGFFLFLFYSRGEWLAAAAMTALQSGMIFSTLCTRFSTTLFFVVTGLTGGGTMIWLAWFKGISF